MLAGISKMEVKRFAKLNAFGATLWLGIFMLSGYLLGEVTLVQDNLETSLLIVVILSAIPLPVELMRNALINRRKAKKDQATK
jgi:membrane-associated protein